MGLRSWTLSALLIALTVLLPLAVLMRVRLSRAGRRAHPRLRVEARDKPLTPLGLGIRWFILVIAQGLAVASFLAVANRQLVFYEEWSDLFGGQDGHPQVALAGPTPPADSPTEAPSSPQSVAGKEPLPVGTDTPSGARLVRLNVNGPASGVRWDVPCDPSSACCPRS